ncbi:uncharacterized protein STEHIDRAFT_111298 [Stereum hirsutum FP-91666 SS1]|uniref:uncharacterized protein n=1 Tax=Stereum hirsutum (strain FP-91666) TaxID=721885 RepID=UPI000444A410|nr:uncharacterized protein STEHIDRAFT_111298 [Stereum hirsutum FP-91666 SS1]EIM86893.1 hypothetical protein STEHIDRAFT_111298 [Stereum hirsutum FP-91666 SS1]
MAESEKERANKATYGGWDRWMDLEAVQSDDGMMARQEMVMCECEVVGKWKVGCAEHHDISYWALDVEMTVGIWKMAVLICRCAWRADGGVAEGRLSAITIKDETGSVKGLRADRGHAPGKRSGRGIIAWAQSWVGDGLGGGGSGRRGPCGAASSAGR